ncbi:MAG: hypothetical protein QNJ46_33160 [Leptolyngbyaceae cyanobacterium MO_188.B28]|nr:hypothetical protein [Leptolyngbyaceae cyanobacterium MO_188.B28]
MQAYPTNLVTPQWLYQYLDDPQVAIADCRLALADPDWDRDSIGVTAIDFSL